MVDRNSKQWWRALALVAGEDYSLLDSAYEGVRASEKDILDAERDIRIEATKMMFRQYASPERWWVLLHQRMRKVVGDGDMNAIRNFDDVARCLASMYPQLKRGEECETTQYVFDFLIGTPGHMCVQSTEEVMGEAWERVFGYPVPYVGPPRDWGDEYAFLENSAETIPF